MSTSIRIPEAEIEFHFTRSSGPGGQNVNKVNSKAVLRWNALESRALPASVRALVLERLASRLNPYGELVLTSDRYRDQLRNREDCLEKLSVIVNAAAIRPKQRKKTKPTRSSRLRKKESKTRDSRKKKLRGRLDF